ncbi:GNAT family N-acetyltransferase [Thermobifida halotolerans]|uniref:GNAT family N-acetyltransferase n=1 Tax=Thermobifida halotolerans TaxID=483545 RepID=A0AA97LY00_9ACTN|nr:GNAT family N-acetyltransferase [Thermobifida halotolerans]UOE20253.1 GNAT family N-acetyltransferase [Thermobifida halotolerans]
MLDIVIARSERERAAVFVIRGAVFVAEQDVPIEEEWDERDAAADHFLALVDGVPVGTGRLLVRGAEGVLGRLAVLRRARGSGVGAALVGAAEERAARRGLVAVELHAQTHALGFYERLGYTAYGPEFEEAGIAHRGMRKELPRRRG